MKRTFLFSIVFLCSGIGLFAQNCNDLKVTYSIKDSCHDGSNGKIVTKVSGGVMPYAYKWSNGSERSFITDLNGGNYSLVVIDQNGCRNGINLKVRENKEIKIDYEIVEDISNYKSVKINQNQRTRDYDFYWFSKIGGFNSTEQNLNSVTPGEYLLIVSNGDGCTKRFDFDLR